MAGKLRLRFEAKTFFLPPASDLQPILAQPLPPTSNLQRLTGPTFSLSYFSNYLSISGST